MIELVAQPLTQPAFAAFGEVIDLRDAQQFSINDRLTTRFHDLFTIDTTDHGGRPIVSVFRTAPLPLPHKVQVMERHPHGSQAFMPMDDAPFLVLVATDTNPLGAADLSLFISNGQQGINLHKNTWHHHQIVLKTQHDFIVIDRASHNPKDNLELRHLNEEVWIPASASNLPSKDI